MAPKLYRPWFWKWEVQDQGASTTGLYWVFFSSLQASGFSLSLHMGKEARELCGIFYKSINFIHQSSILMTYPPPKGLTP